MRFILPLILVAGYCHGQQSFSLKHNLNTILDETSASINDQKTRPKILGFYGAGNVNTEAFNNLNSSGKLAFYIKPLVGNPMLTMLMSFNKNATNSDSILATTLLFPEVGNHSFLCTIEYSMKLGKTNSTEGAQFFVPFAEMSYKNFKIRDTVTSTNPYFSMLNWTLGAKFNTVFYRDKYFAGISIAPFLSFYNVPDEDTTDYKVIFKSPNMKDNFMAGGVKIIFQFKDFQIFGDLRHVFGDANKLTREIRGFNPNVGVVFNAEIFEL